MHVYFYHVWHLLCIHIMTWTSLHVPKFHILTCMFKQTKELSSSWVYNNENNIMQHIKICTYLKYISQSNWAQTNFKNWITKMSKQSIFQLPKGQDMGRYIHPPFKKLHPKVMVNLNMREKFLTQLIYVFHDSKPYVILFLLELHFIKTCWIY